MTVLCRTLKRTFLLSGPLPEDCVAFLHADPLLSTSTERTETIEVAPRGDGLFSLRASWGREMTGSARALTQAIDDAVYRLAAADEASSPSLNASALRVAGTRIVLAAEIGLDHSELVVALLAAGAAFEGTGLVFLRAEGVAAHPAKPRLRLHRLAAAGVCASHRAPALLGLDKDDTLCAIDPRMAGVEWSVTEGPVQVLLLVERNDGGRSAMARLRFEPALVRLMRSVRIMRQPSIRDFVRLRSMIESVEVFRLAVGNAVEAAAMIIAQMPYLRVDQ